MPDLQPRGGPHILFAGDSTAGTETLRHYLEGRGCTIRRARDRTDFSGTILDNRPDCIIINAETPGDRALCWLGETPYHGPIIVLADRDKDDGADLSAARRAAFVIARPVGAQHLYRAVDALSRCIPRFSAVESSLPGEIAGLSNMTTPDTEDTPMQPERRDFNNGFIGTSSTMQVLYERIQNAARSRAAVFITGESGTGKEVCARAVHQYSARRERAFVPINCAAIPRDLLESALFGHVRGAFTGAIADRDGAVAMADGGTLFLDEIGEMDPNMQTKLLRFLQDGTYQRVGDGHIAQADVRIICATNRDPIAEVRAGRFREDLFYRLHVIPITMPPLRERGDDVIDIAQILLIRYAQEEGKRFKGFTRGAEEALRRYSWPGNIRQLQNVLRNAVVMHDGLALTAEMIDLPANDAPEHRLGDLDGSRTGVVNVQSHAPIRPLHLVERETIEAAIRYCCGNIPRAAALLEISPSTIYRKRAGWDGIGDHETGTDTAHAAGNP